MMDNYRSLTRTDRWLHREFQPVIVQVAEAGRRIFSHEGREGREERDKEEFHTLRAKRNIDPCYSSWCPLCPSWFKLSCTHRHNNPLMFISSLVGEDDRARGPEHAADAVADRDLGASDLRGS